MTTLLFSLGVVCAVLFVGALLMQRRLHRLAADESGDEEEITRARYSPESLRRARTRGAKAGYKGEPLTSCPYHQCDQPLADEWRDYHALGVLKKRHNIPERPRRLLMEEPESETPARNSNSNSNSNGKDSHHDASDLGKDRRRPNKS